MVQLPEEFVVDVDGNRKAVLGPISNWEEILDALEELEDIRAFDEAKLHLSDPIPFEQAVSEIRKCKK